MKALSDEFRTYAHNISLSRLALITNNYRVERGEGSQVETMRNALGYGILQFELNGPARAIAMGSKILRRDEAESDRLRDVLRTPFARAEELRQATRGFDLHKLAKASTGIRFRNDARSPVPAPAIGHAGASL